MVWVATAGCTLIACALLFNWYNKKIVNNDGYRERNTDNNGKARHYEGSSEEFDRTASTVVQITKPVVEDSPRTNISAPPKFEISLPSIDDSDIDADRTPSMEPPPVAPSKTIPSMHMPPPRSKSPPRLKPPTFSQAPPRPGGVLRPPPSAASSLRVPVTRVLSNSSMAPSSLMLPPQKKSRAVALEPGHSPLDWAALTSNPTNNLRGRDAPTTFVRVTPSQLKAQNGRKGKDTWTVYQGKVYNLTPYVPFHPGGKGEILRGAGKDSAKLFNEVHPWVNWDGMLKECMVGIFVSEDEMKKSNELDEMD